MKADGTIWIDTKIDESGMEEGFNRIRDGADDVAVSARKAGQEIEKSFSKLNVNKAIANAEAQIRDLKAQLDAVSIEFADAVAMDDDKSAEKLGAKRERIYDRLARAREKLAIEVAAAAEKEAKEEEKAAQKTVEAAQKDAAAKKQAMASQFEGAGNSADRFGSRLRGIISSAFIFNILSAGLRNVTSYFGSALMANNQFATAVYRLQGSLMVAFQPIYETVLPALIKLINWLNVAVQAVARFFSVLAGKSYKQMQQNAQVLNSTANSANSTAGAVGNAGDAIENAGKQAKKAEKYLAGFDEINRMLAADAYDVSDNIGGTGSGSLPTDDFKAPIFEEVELPTEWETAIDKLAMKFKDIFFEWENLTPENVVEKLLTALTMLVGGLIGFALGGAKGAVIGVTIGAALGVILSSMIFDGDGKLSAQEILQTLLTVLGIVGGGLIGFKLGGPGGALIGATIGLGLSFLLDKMVFDQDGSITTEELINSLMSVLMVLGGAAIGFFLGGAGGAVIGAAIGLAISFAVLSTSFDSVQKEYDELNKKVEKWSDDTTKTTEERYIKPTQSGFAGLLKNMTKTIESTKDDLIFNMGLAATGTDAGFFEPMARWSQQLSENLKRDNKTAADRVIETWENAAIQNEVGFVIPTKEQFASAAEWISEKFKDAKESVMDKWRGMSAWFQQTVTEPISGFFQKLTDGIIERFYKVSDSVNSAIQTLISNFNSIVSTLSQGINQMRQQYSSAKQSVSSTSYASTAAYTTMAYPTADVPMLAKGAVIPPNKKFLAVLGDQTHGTNIEAPLATIQEAVALVMEDVIQSNIAGHEATVELLQQILEAILGIELDGETISRAVAGYNRKMAMVRGSEA